MRKHLRNLAKKVLSKTEKLKKRAAQVVRPPTVEDDDLWFERWHVFQAKGEAFPTPRAAQTLSPSDTGVIRADFNTSRPLWVSVWSASGSW